MRPKLLRMIHGTSTNSRFVVPSEEKNEDMELMLSRARETGESYGGTAYLRLVGLPKNLGQPVFHKLKSELCSAFLSIGATTGAELGQGFSATEKSGKEFHNIDQDYGGIRGGLSTGDPITMRVAFNPHLHVKRSL